MRSGLNIVNLILMLVLCLAALSAHEMAQASNITPMIHLVQ